MTLTKTNKWFMIAGITLVFTGIILGAFGAHSLEQINIDPKKITSWKTGVLYQLLQGFGLLLLSIISSVFELQKTKLSLRLLLIGTLLFSCSIYLLTLNSIWNIDALKYTMGPATPVGGLLMITGWISFLTKAIKIPTEA